MDIHHIVRYTYMFIDDAIESHWTNRTNRHVINTNENNLTLYPITSLYTYSYM